jgi:hypothetical protein
MRFILAFSSFFRLLFGARLDPRVAEYLPEEAKKELTAGEKPEEKEEKEEAKKAEKAEKAAAEKKPEPRPTGAGRTRHHRDGALAMLSLLQREGRLIDFLLEDIDDYDDADIGAAVRDIHRGCRKVLVDHLTLEAVMPGEEEEEVKVPAGFDPTEIRLVGEAGGDPPFAGVLRHHGWRVTRADLPTLSDGVDRNVIAPAEVEVGS